MFLVLILNKINSETDMYNSTKKTLDYIATAYHVENKRSNDDIFPNDQQFAFDFAITKGDNNIKRSRKTYKTFTSIFSINSCIEISTCLFDSCCSLANAGAIDVQCDFHQISFYTSCFRKCISQLSSGAIYSRSYAYSLRKICFDGCYSVTNDGNTMKSIVHSNSTFFGSIIISSCNPKSSTSSLMEILPGGRQHNINLINISKNNQVSSLMQIMGGIKIYARSMNIVNNTFSSDLLNIFETLDEYIIVSSNVVNIKAPSFAFCPGICSLKISEIRFKNSSFEFLAVVEDYALISIHECVSDIKYQVKGSVLSYDFTIIEEVAQIEFSTFLNVCQLQGNFGPILGLAESCLLATGIILIGVAIAITYMYFKRKIKNSREKLFYDDSYINQIIDNENSGGFN